MGFILPGQQFENEIRGAGEPRAGVPVRENQELLAIDLRVELGAVGVGDHGDRIAVEVIDCHRPHAEHLLFSIAVEIGAVGKHDGVPVAPGAEETLELPLAIEEAEADVAADHHPGGFFRLAAPEADGGRDRVASRGVARVRMAERAVELLVEFVEVDFPGDFPARLEEADHRVHRGEDDVLARGRFPGERPRGLEIGGHLVLETLLAVEPHHGDGIILVPQPSVRRPDVRLEEKGLAVLCSEIHRFHSEGFACLEDVSSVVGEEGGPRGAHIAHLDPRREVNHLEALRVGIAAPVVGRDHGGAPHRLFGDLVPERTGFGGHLRPAVHHFGRGHEDLGGQQAALAGAGGLAVADLGEFHLGAEVHEFRVVRDTGGRVDLGWAQQAAVAPRDLPRGGDVAEVPLGRLCGRGD